MLIGAFDLLLAKQNELEAYQKYLEAIRDYWIFRADLQRSLGGRLPATAQNQNDFQTNPLAGAAIKRDDICLIKNNQSNK
jgi:hypothetical protein